MTTLKIDYVEFQTANIEASKRFFEAAFGWSYADYGPEYQEIEGAGLSGGLTTLSNDNDGAPLVILRTDDLEAASECVAKAGGEIVKPIFSFPGGRRFHFREPSGNVLAVWSSE